MQPIENVLERRTHSTYAAVSEVEPLDNSTDDDDDIDVQDELDEDDEIDDQDNQSDPDEEPDKDSANGDADLDDVDDEREHEQS
jgi:hypothetical protein